MLFRSVCWSIDFMSDTLSNTQRFRTLNVIDDFNREALLIKPSFSLPANNVIKHLDNLAQIKGYPESIRTDNGPEFISDVFKNWTIKNNISLQYIQPGKPAQNAYIERFNRTYREDILDIHLFDNLKEVKNITNNWIKIYNEERPHEALENHTPNSFYNLHYCN